MAENWFYVQKGNRLGPVEIDVIQSLIRKEELKPEDYVWKKGFDNWKKIKDVSDLSSSNEEELLIPPVTTTQTAKASTEIEKKINLLDLNQDERIIFLRIGNDRGVASSDYGPFSVNQLKKLYHEHRINGKSFIFCTGMKEWMVLADLEEFEQVFNELPPVIQESDRRTFARKPFVARLFIQNNKKLFEGICRDISIGGMQILIDDFKGQVGDKISINVHPENTDHHFVASGVVVRILEGNSGFSFRFQGLSDEAKRAIEKYLQEN